MKRCPKCNADYFDNMLEFCLEDGTRLSAATAITGSTTAHATQPTAETRSGVHAPIANRDSVETVVIPVKDIGTASGTAIESRPDSPLARVIETAPIGIALAHNWWQWLYLEKTYVSSVTEYVLSANFLMWLLLLSVGTASGIYALKYSKNKGFAIISLVALAINLILFVVPRR